MLTASALMLFGCDNKIANHNEKLIENIIDDIRLGWENGDGAAFRKHFLDWDGARYFEGGGQNVGLEDLIVHHVEPEAELGLDLAGHGWHNLYNPDHTPKGVPSNPDPKNPFQPYIYGGNVNRDKLDIRYAKGDENWFEPSRDAGFGGIFGLFGFKWSYLKMFNELEESPLEISESCDSNRLYDNGYTQRIATYPYFDSYAVDVPEDIDQVEHIMKKDKYWRMYNDK